MSVQLRVQVKGFKEMQRDLKRYPEKAEAVFGEAVTTAARALAEGTRMNAQTPVDTGRMRASINHKRLAKLAAAMFVGTHYAVYVHEGTRRVKGRPFIKWTLEGGFQKAIDAIFTKAMNSIP